MTVEELTKLAAQGGEVPPELNAPDSFLFLSLRALYAHARATGMSPEQGKKEKQEVLSQYESLNLWLRVFEEHTRKEREVSCAWKEFTENPSFETGNAVHRAWYGCDLKKEEEQEEC